jgi:hypothetical protein
MFHFLAELPLRALQPRPRNVICWLAAIALAYGTLINAWLTDGYFSCDFAGQWLMGRMVTAGRAKETYWAAAEREVLALGYSGEQLKTMDEHILQKCPRGQTHTGVEGPLYPPTMGVLMIPFGTLTAQSAHAVLILLYAQLVFLTGWLFKEITRGRVRMGEASLLVVLFPHFGMGVVLGQNSVLTLAILAGGWALWARGWAFSGGLVWGLLAYKPVFAVAVLLVPILLWSGRLLLGLLAGGGLFCLATLVVYGFDLVTTQDGMIALNADHPWRRWLTVGANASTLYSYDINWIWMSRDLLGLPRRDMWNLDFLMARWEGETGQVTWNMWAMQPADLSDRATAIGTGLIIGVGAMTTLIVLARAVWQRIRLAPPGETRAADDDHDRVIGARPAFIWLGALLTSYHFMWYDLQLMALPAVLLLADSRRMSWLGRGWLIFVGAAMLACVLNLAFGVGTVALPFETFLLLLVWLWAGGRTLFARTPLAQSPGQHHVDNHAKGVAEVKAL